MSGEKVKYRVKEVGPSATLKSGVDAQSRKKNS